MLSWVGALCKLALLGLIAIMAANWFEWQGRTISDHIKLGMAYAERSAGPRNSALNYAERARRWVRDLAGDARKGAPRELEHKIAPIAGDEDGARERIPAEERQKLRALLRD